MGIGQSTEHTRYSTSLETESTEHASQCKVQTTESTMHKYVGNGCTVQMSGVLLHGTREYILIIL